MSERFNQEGCEIKNIRFKNHKIGNCETISHSNVKFKKSRITSLKKYYNIDSKWIEEGLISSESCEVGLGVKIWVIWVKNLRSVEVQKELSGRREKARSKDYQLHLCYFPLPPLVFFFFLNCLTFPFYNSFFIIPKQFLIITQANSLFSNIVIFCKDRLFNLSEPNIKKVFYHDSFQIVIFKFYI